MRTITGTIGAYITGSLGPADLIGDPCQVLNNLSYFNYSGMENYGWARVGTATITVEIEDEQQLIRNKIDALKSEKNAILGEAQAKATEIDGKINNLLAITYVPEEA